MKRITRLQALGSLLAITLIAGCGEKASEPPATEPEAAVAEPAMSVYEAAVASEARPDEDRARDAGRKPAEILEFMGIEPGMTVLDMFTGGGSGRLTNVEVLMAENNELSLEADTLDAVMLVLSFHDLYHSDAENGWPKIDGPAFLAELKKGLKPGGIVAIIDHAAAAGSPSDTGTTVHRIDPAIVLADMEAAGFVCEETSDILRNPDDDYSKMVFAEGIRGNTDRFVMRFRNPE